MDQQLLITAGSLLWIVGGFAGVVGMCTYLGGRAVGRQEGAEERAWLRLQLRLATEGAEFVDHAREHGLLDPQEVLR